MATIPAETAVPGEVAPAARPAATSRGAWYALALLTLTYLLAFVDRQIMSVLVEPIKADLGLTDTQLGSIQGIAFGLVFTLAAIPMGWLADRMPRRVLISGAVLVWSALTAACGAASSAAQLLIARTGVGIGESALGPCAAPLIRDLFPREKVGRALSIYTLGIPLGGGLAVALGAILLPAVTGWHEAGVPVFAALEPWQGTFLVVALPGLLIAPLMLTVSEPRRAKSGEPGGAAPVPEALAFFLRHWRTFVGFGLPGIAAMLMTFGTNFWIPAALVRTYALSPQEASLTFKSWGLIAMVLGVIGSLGCGLVIDRVRARRDDAYLLFAAGSLAVAALSYAGFLYAPTPGMALALLAPAALATCIPPVCAAAGAMEIIPKPMRSFLFAIWMLLISLVGSSIGAPLIGFLTDHVFGRPEALRHAISLTALIATGLAVPLLLAVRGSYRRTLAAAQAY